MKSKHQVEKPEILTTDHRGTPFEVGSIVAFNCSGAVDIGVIHEIKKNDWKKARKGVGKKSWWYADFHITIVREDRGVLSNVKNPLSFVVIKG